MAKFNVRQNARVANKIPDARDEIYETRQPRGIARIAITIL